MEDDTWATACITRSLAAMQPMDFPNLFMAQRIINPPTNKLASDPKKKWVLDPEEMTSP